jgi:Uma2 family endonuclease
VTIETGERRPPTSYAPPLVSWEDFHDWALDQETRSEWVDGEIVAVPPESVEHYQEVDFLDDFIKAHVRRNKLGQVYSSTFLMKLPNRPTGRHPDVMFLANEHADRRRRTYIDGPADLVVEVVSSKSETRDRYEKFAEYEAAGIPEYWLIDEPRHEAYFFVLGVDGRYQQVLPDSDGIYTSAVVTDLRLRVSWLWLSPPPSVEEALADLPD